jgi:NhaP-type Na+/H+ or K+/H+ antiporter
MWLCRFRLRAGPIDDLYAAGRENRLYVQYQTDRSATPEAVPIFLVITAVLAWLNARFLKLPSTIGVMAAALMLSGLERDVLVTITYTVVVFSVLVQGLTIEKLVRALMPCAG